jgi:endonuclease-3
MKLESLEKAKYRSKKIFVILKSTYPNTSTFLTHKNTFELLIAVILSAQCTDERVNQVTPTLFERFPTPRAFCNATLTNIEEEIKSVNFFKTKAKHIQRTCQRLISDYNSVVPDSLIELIKLPGVGRKTANVVLGQAFGIPGVTVDTHVKRLSQRLQFTTQTDAEKIEYEICQRWPKSIWIDMSSLLILHGRKICNARTPKCTACVIASLCPSMNK